MKMFPISGWFSDFGVSSDTSSIDQLRRAYNSTIKMAQAVKVRTILLRLTLVILIIMYLVNYFSHNKWFNLTQNLIVNVASNRTSTNRWKRRIVSQSCRLVCQCCSCSINLRVAVSQPKNCRIQWKFKTGRLICVFILNVYK